MSGIRHASLTGAGIDDAVHPTVGGKVAFGRTTYTGVTEPIRSDFQASMQISPDSPAAWDSGILRTYTGRVGDWRTTIRVRP